MKIVFIHGRDQEGKEPVVLQQQWESALDDGLEKAGISRPAIVSIEFPFYGDTLDRLVTDLDSPLIENARGRGVDRGNPDVQFRNDLLEELREGLNISESEVTAEYTGDISQRSAQNWEWVHSILKVLDRTPLGAAAIDEFTRDVSVYLTNEAVQEQIDAIVQPHIVEEPCVVVGHSLGSIVGYNVLQGTDNQVVRYVTVGSPLGINAIKRKLKGALRMPSTTTSWFNAMDERDVVALYPLDDRHFPISPSITNKTTVDNYTDNRHGIGGYLSDPDVARNIAEPFV